MLLSHTRGHEHSHRIDEIAHRPKTPSASKPTHRLERTRIDPFMLANVAGHIHIQL